MQQRIRFSLAIQRRPSKYFKANMLIETHRSIILLIDIDKANGHL